MTMAMQSVYAFGKNIGHLRLKNAKTRARSTRIVEFGLNLGMFGIDSDSARDFLVGHLIIIANRLDKTIVLRKRVKSNMTRALQNFVELAFLIGRRIDVCTATKLLEGKTSLVERTCRCVTDVLAEHRKCLPKGESLESQNKLDLCPIHYRADKREIAAQEFLLHYITRIRNRIQPFVFNHILPIF